MDRFGSDTVRADMGEAGTAAMPGFMSCRGAKDQYRRCRIASFDGVRTSKYSIGTIFLEDFERCILADVHLWMVRVEKIKTAFYWCEIEEWKGFKVICFESYIQNRREAFKAVEMRNFRIAIDRIFLDSS